MNPQPIITPAVVSSEPQSAGSVRLRGPWLIAGLAAWAAIFILSLAVFGLSVYFIYASQLLPCTARWDPRACAEFGHALHQLGLSFSFFGLYFLALQIVAALPYFVLSILIVRRRSDALMALLFAIWLPVVGAAGTWFNPIWQWLNVPELNPLIGWLGETVAVTLPNQFLRLVLYSGLVIACYTFPDGRFVPRWTRWLALLWISLGVTGMVFPGSPFDGFTWPDPLLHVFILGYIASIVYALLYRYRHSADLVQRQQFKWFAAGICMPILNLLVDYTTFEVYPYLTGRYPLPTGMSRVVWEFAQDTHWYVSSFIFAMCIGVIVFRYRLWNIDLIINRALVYGALTALVISIYVVVVGALGAAVQSSGNLLIALVATGTVAAVFQPLRYRLQRGVNRLMYGERDDPVTVLSRLGQRLEATMTQEAVLPIIVETVAQALRLPYVALEVREGQEFRMAAAYGQPATKPFHFPLIYQHQLEMIGQLVVAPRAAGEAFSAAERQLLENIAHQAGAAVQAVQLTADLQRSRERLVRAREEERRRLRRDLHDGLGPLLASQALTIDAILKLLEQDPQAAAALLRDLKAQSQTAILDIRRLVYNLRPPALDDLGLAAALKAGAAQYQNSGVDIAVIVPQPLPLLPAAVEVAAYRIAQEAITNVVRHAGAQMCEVRLALTCPQEQEGLCIEILDNGRGLKPNQHAGVGLQSIRERTAELGGRCVIETRDGGGTRISAWLPLPQEHHEHDPHLNC